MAKLKRLATREDGNLVDVLSPLSMSEIGERNKDYNVLTPKQFGTKYKDLLFAPTEFTWDGFTYQIQYNHCANPYCKYHSQPQVKYPTKGKPTRYKLSGISTHKSIKCNPDPTGTAGGVLGCYTSTLSNWSVAQEIQRLVRINSVQDNEPNYVFHKAGCIAEVSTPFTEPESFYKQGKGRLGTQRFQCKICKKKTTLTPGREQSSTYNQKRNEINLSFAKLLLSRTPVTKTCEFLGIGRGTYYDKLEFLYRRCLEFLERHEIKPLQKLEFKEMWVNTDKMTYYLNNVRQKGMGGSRYDDVEENQFPTHTVVSADVESRYVFRGDVAYDWEVALGDIALDTVLQKEDHLNEFAKKHAHYPKFSHYPQPPSANDTQNKSEYYKELTLVERRAKYTDGLHVGSTYTTIAHLWLIKQLVKAREWRFVTDEDHSLMTSINRVFSKEIRLSDAHHFLCQTDKTKTRKQAREEFVQARVDLINWGTLRGYGTRSLRKLAYLQMSELFETHTFHKEVITPSGTHLEYADNPILHPLATIDRGKRSVDCTTNLSSLEPKDVASLMLNVNDNATNTFIHHIRRSISILERPLTTARGDGKTYIYSNFNPKYAQMAITILRTYYNFCKPYKTKDITATPAQRLGLTDKQFSLKDIIYLR
ncbi:insertion element protein [Lottiidibacillus patelloidae]|uniref:Insertion element protein n=1 Tax=Lottiidibacillus patelloidae TaxID=2670334 RepID=A0A263BSK8_9BACI|nr:insertion element protein [Lottiidibacillus patelloidae]